MMIKAVIFDLGYVIIHDIANERIFQDIADACDLKSVDTTISLLLPLYQRGELSDEQFWRAFKERTGIAKLPAEYRKLWSRRYINETHIDHEVMQLILTLRANDYKTGCLSNTIPPHVEANRERGLFKPFDFCVFSYEIRSRKPEPKIFHTAIQAAGCKPNEIVYIDDIEEYVHAARELGMHGIKYNVTKQPVEHLRRELNKLNVL